MGLAKGLWPVAGIVVLAAVVGGSVGAFIAATIVTTNTSPGSSSSLPAQGVAERLEAINTLFGADWPHVNDNEEWRTYLYNAQTPIEGEWVNGLSGRIHIDGVDMMRTRVEDWRERFEAWVDEAGELLREHPPSNSHDSVEAVHSRGLRILEHVDALLGR